MPLTIMSPAFDAGEPIPKKYAYKGEGDNISPPLRWTGAPAGTRTFVLICDDPDAPSPQRPRANPWVHWVVYDIQGDCMSLSEGEHMGTLGRTDFGSLGWGGPMPPPGSGKHRYFFRLYAVDVCLDIPMGCSKADVMGLIEEHIIEQAEHFGTYER